MMGELGVLSLLVALPLTGGLLLYLVPGAGAQLAERCRRFSMLIAGVTLLLSLLVWFRFDGSSGAMEMQERLEWVADFGISYHLGIDGISLYLVLLTTLLSLVVVYTSFWISSKRRGYLAAVLILESAMLGTLLALDLFLFYLFWELMLIPLYFIIGLWGGAGRIYAALKFVIYTVLGSVLMLAAILYLVWAHYAAAGDVTFSLQRLLSHNTLTLAEELWLFGAFALAFAIKVPLFPFHTWLPDAHVEAPTGGSVILAGVLLKMGIYGFIRFAYPLFPVAADLFAPYLALIAVVGIIYGALLAWVQDDIKKLVAYSSISHLGFCALGVAACTTISLSGSIYQMVCHGISTGALFLLVGVLYEQRHTRLISEYGGLAQKVPVFAFLFMIFTLSSIALPLTGGFVGEFMILAGSFVSPLARPYALFAISGVVLGAVYMLTLYMNTMFGEFDEQKNGKLLDIRLRELAVFIPLGILVFSMGVYPKPILDDIEPAVSRYVLTLAERRGARSDSKFEMPDGSAVPRYEPQELLYSDGLLQAGAQSVSTKGAVSNRSI